MDYYALPYGTLRLYKMEPSESKLYVYAGNCAWKKVRNQNKIQGILCKIDEIEANDILEKIEGDNYFICDGIVGIYD